MAVADNQSAMESDLSVQKLVQKVYEATLFPHLLPEAIESFTRALRGDIGLLLIRDQADHRLAVVAASQGPEQTRSETQTGPETWLPDPWLDTLWPQGEAVELNSRTAWPPPVGDGVCSALIAPVGPQGALAFFRRLPQPRFDDADRAMLQSLAAQLGHAVSLLAQIATQHRRAAVAEEMLDLIATPLLLVDAQARLVSANTCGRVALDLRDGIALIGGQVCAQALRSNARLQSLIADVARTASQGSSRVQAVSLSRGVDRRPLGITLRPLPSRVCLGGVGGLQSATGLVLLDLSALDLQGPPQPWLLQDLFALTPAEAALLQALMQDKRIEDHALARGVSVTTVRTQLAHLFRKTGTNRQSELVRMASRAVGGLRVDDLHEDGPGASEGAGLRPVSSSYFPPHGS